MAIKVNQIIRSNRKTIALIIQPDGSLLVRAPYKAKEDQIQSWVIQKSAWILKKQAEVKARTPTAASHVFMDGELFYFLGKLYPLRITREGGKGLALDGVFIISETAAAQARQLFAAWYRQQASGVLVERTRNLAQNLGFQFKQVKISSAMTRWGSCSTQGVISYTWRLVMAPVEVIDYVIVHELVHTLVRNHSQKFWSRVSGIMPDYMARAEWLKTNGQQLRLD